ncbi:MAG: BON domain-containing protein [Rhizobacter sp.]|nr:BON domain-containing protein [Rhizobacter sp.]
MNALKTTTAAACALAAALALSACDRRDDNMTAGERLDTAVASADQKADQMKADAKREGAEVRSDVNRAVDQAGDKMKDASITTKVNAELAQDSELSALKINVDTNEGRVVLRGTAPSDSARDRATMLAQRVDGVLAVDNQLTVRSQG